MSNESDEIDRGPPRRYLDKQEAIRHLVHGAIRLVMAKEDPFVIQLIAHSADKLLIDAAKKRGTYLELDWELYIKDEYHRDFFKDYRQTYNYFKHADTDFTKQLAIYDIAVLNVMAVFMCAVNYVKLFQVSSHHVRAYFWFIQLLMPHVVKLPNPKFNELFQQALEDSLTLLRPNFSNLSQTMPLNSHCKWKRKRPSTFKTSPISIVRQFPTSARLVTRAEKSAANIKPSA
jgi:hypothetical protein